MISRRNFINGMIGAAAVERLSKLHLMAAGDDYKALVCVFLFGGNDCNNTVVPMQSQAYAGYQAARGGLALAQNTLLPVGNFGLHPRLADLKTLYDQKKAAIVANVGMLVRPVTRDEYRQRSVALPNNLFSHSDQQMQWQCSVADGSAVNGWAGRAADSLASMNANKSYSTVSLAGNTVFLMGKETKPALINPGAPPSLAGFSTAPEQQARLRAYQEMLLSDQGYLLVQAGSQITAEGLRISSLLSSVLSSSAPLATAFPATGLGRQLEQIARLIRARNQFGVTRQVFFTSIGGWDTHINQISAQDALFNQLGPALGAFYRATEELGIASQVTTFTESEFGRTLNPSSGAGSDHGWGSHHFVLGGAVKGGEMYGRFPTVAINSPDDASGRGVWVPTTSMDQYGATLATWFGVPRTALGSVMANIGNFPNADLGFLG
ncbi:MAG: DUF1501 domain-containing protein [Bryobacterales bacterium]|nr:DUF1501 domain-containing protein [Bryobacterales bacterium]